ICPSEAAQRLGVAWRALQRRIVRDDRLIDRAHVQQGVADRDKRRGRSAIDRGSPAIKADGVRQIAGGTRGGAEAHQRVIVERDAATVATVGGERIETVETPAIGIPRYFSAAGQTNQT